MGAVLRATQLFSATPIFLFSASVFVGFRSRSNVCYQVIVLFCMANKSDKNSALVVFESHDASRPFNA